MKNIGKLFAETGVGRTFAKQKLAKLYARFNGGGEARIILHYTMRSWLATCWRDSPVMRSINWLSSFSETRTPSLRSSPKCLDLHQGSSLFFSHAVHHAFHNGRLGEPNFRLILYGESPLVYFKTNV